MTDKTAIITGAASGIGKATLELFKSKGYRVIGLDVEEGAECRKVDISNSNDVQKFCKDLSGENIKVDVLVNNAAVQVEKQLVDTEEDEWDRVFGVNVKSIYLLTRYLDGQFSGTAAIVNVSSVHARNTSIGLASYVASKGAVSALTRAMALELAPKGIRVNSVLPGAVDTPMLQKGLGRNASHEESLSKLKRSTPLGKLGEPGEVASLIYFLSNNDSASNITGQEFVCDGGVTAKLASE